MPRGIYERKRGMAKINKKTLRRSKALRRRIELAVGDAEAEFLTHGSTYAKERIVNSGHLENAFDNLLREANVLADFVLASVPYAHGIPASVGEAYKSVKHRMLMKHSKV